jgi:drug/metabolite transporter (DMT)-like permease
MYAYAYAKDECCVLWIVFALTTALFEALKDTVLKHSVRNIPATVAAWAWMFFALPFLGTALLWTAPVELGGQFWLALLAGALLNIAAISLYAQALEVSDLSVSVPMIAFSPLFLLITSPLIVGEFPDIWGVLGVILIVAGSYLLNIKTRQQGYLEPYRALLREPGPRYMLGVAAIWAIAANVDKVGVTNSSPIFWVSAMTLSVSLGLTLPMLRTPGSTTAIRTGWPFLVLVGMFSAVAITAQMFALTLTLVAYVISIKRLSILLGVVFGTLIFKEQGFRERLTGVLVMLAGVLCITLL